MELKDLIHVTEPIATGGEVIVLNTGAIITSEAQAMLQALHSRSVGGLRSHLEILNKKGAEKFMSNFYVGYGHKSIGDCGTTTLFVEGISMPAIKAIQDWPLYSGQSASTRYIDFQVQPFSNPLGTKAGEDILEAWRSFYVKALEPMQTQVMGLHPIQDGENENTYIKAVKARVFDMLRGFLPSGIVSNMAWHTNLRQAADKLEHLRHHPLKEVKAIADAIEKALQKSHASSFGHKRYEATEKYREQFMQNEYYYHNHNCPDFKLTRNNIDPSQLPVQILQSRPAKTELPKFIDEAGTIQFEFTLDFGSFRDIQRHRALTQRMPLITTDLGFHEWYLEGLTNELRREAASLLQQQEDRITQLDVTPEERQYYIAMGYKVANRVTGHLPALVYMAELRATRFVHPTLRMRATQIAQVLEKELSQYGLIMHLDKEPDRFDIKRGEHDIELKED